MRMGGVTALAALMALPISGFAQSNSGSRVRIATNLVTATGCHDSIRTFTSPIPNADKLDRSYHGVVAGIEMVETAANNGHAIRNVAYANNGTAITYELFAKGAGYWVDPPKVFGTPIGGGYCHGAEGGSEGVEFYAHYTQP